MLQNLRGARSWQFYRAIFVNLSSGSLFYLVDCYEDFMTAHTPMVPCCDETSVGASSAGYGT